MLCAEPPASPRQSAQPSFPEQMMFSPSFGDTVGVHDDHVAGMQGAGVDEESGIGKDAEQRAEPTEFEWLPRLAAADEPRRMTGKRHRDRPGTLFSTKASHGSSAVTSTIVVEQHLVDDCQNLAWVVVFDRGGRHVYRASAVTTAASTPLPQTSPTTTAQSSTIAVYTS